jgi:hypothetical protein
MNADCRFGVTANRNVRNYRPNARAVPTASSGEAERSPMVALADRE